tara:strand:+ start:24512 stop:24724 length:213 start_codon:yes stop_codon:yes gene_type:complete
MKRTFILLIVISCNNPDVSIDAHDFGPSEGHTWLEFSAYYPLGDKYYEDADSALISTWLSIVYNNKIKQI